MSGYHLSQSFNRPTDTSARHCSTSDAKLSHYSVVQRSLLRDSSARESSSCAPLCTLRARVVVEALILTEALISLMRLFASASRRGIPAPCTARTARAAISQDPASCWYASTGHICSFFQAARTNECAQTKPQRRRRGNRAGDEPKDTGRRSSGIDAREKINYKNGIDLRIEIQVFRKSFSLLSRLGCTKNGVGNACTNL